MTPGEDGAAGRDADVVERFAAAELDRERWVPAYLPAWSSLAAAAATYRLTSDGLHLSIPPEQPLWCPGLHPEPLRVSAVQSGNWSGPVGSTRAPQPFRDGLTVREEQRPLTGLVRRHGRIEVRCRASIGPGSMFSAWMVGMEDEPERSGEICLVEVFGSGVRGGRAEVGAGIHPFRDPGLVDEFAAPLLEIDVRQWHSYAVEWSATGVRWLIDGIETSRSSQSPGYPMMLMLGLFEFPDAVPRNGPGLVPELVVQRVTWSST